MPHPLTSRELCSKYLAFFGEREHATIPSASLVPANDPTVLFTTAGMHPLVPNLLGEPHPAGRRLANVQKCVRTGDIDLIGDDTHLTLFEMLGNWSLGDYGRDDAIRWSFEFLTGALALPLARLGVTCFAGDDEIPADHESVEAWRALGIPRARIAMLGRDDNFWGPAGATGPCGPDTEIFYWVDASPPPAELDPADPRWVEIWNNVFMSYTKTATGALVPLSRVNVDTGMGLERTLVALGGLRSVYEVDTVRPLIDELRGVARTAHERELRILADHVRAACFLVSDGVGPSNKDRGYVVRRLLRRSILFAQRLGLPAAWFHAAVASVVRMLGHRYPELERDPDATVAVFADEARRFERALAAGARALRKHSVLDGKAAFDLLQTHGLPVDLARELARASGIPVVEGDLDAELDEHRRRSRTTRGFAGGLADHSVEIVRYHTLTHLLQSALRRVLGDHVIQRGSNITRERLRFDFSHDARPSPEQLAEVEAMVNGWLAGELVVERATMREPEARALGAIGAFGESYGEIVSVYTIRDAVAGDVISRELCGGPHVHSSREIGGRLHITRELGISAGIRRIRAVLAG